MKNAAYILMVLVAAAGLLWAAGADEKAVPAGEGEVKKAEVHANWITDFEEAKRLAAEKKVPILADFSGSDWCGWCMKLDGEVFSRSAFKEYAKDNLVLFLADFPAAKPQPEELKKQNQGLAEKYGVRGFPTVFLMDSKGEVLVRMGYMRGGAEAYVKHIRQALKN